jgi:murein tripeptide amidase MpaA
MEITCNFDGGKIGVVACERPDDIRLALPPDNASPFLHWFYFRIAGVRGTPLTMTIVNAGDAVEVKDTMGMPDTWEDYQALASYDRVNWFRLPTEYDRKVLRWKVTPEFDAMYFATFVPYSLERHYELVARAQMSPHVRHSVLGRTPDGHDLDMLTFGEPGAGKKVCWITTRQHPSETAGSWCIEGLIERLLDDQDAISRALLKKAVFHVVVNMNPDGSRRGNTRSNATGINLNREWEKPTMERSPEVFLVRQKMSETGVDFYLDAHAWSGTHVFALGPYNVPSITNRQVELWQRYEAALATADPDFEVGWKYPGGGPEPGKADTKMAWNWISEQGGFGVLYELIYKDNRNNRDPVRGWSSDRCKKLGRATLDALYNIVDDLGAKPPPAP